MWDSTCSDAGRSSARMACSGVWRPEQPERVEELAGDLGRVAVPAVDLVVEPAHRRGVDLAGEAVEDARERGMSPQGLAADEGDGVIGGEEVAVVVEDDEVEADDP